MKVLLVSPPQAEPDIPPERTAYVAGALRAAGFQVRHKDANIESYEYFFSPEFLGKCRARVSDALERLEATNSLAPEDRIYYQKLLGASLAADFVVANVIKAKNTIRDHRLFANGQEYMRAKVVFDNAFELISAAYYPARLDFWCFGFDEAAPPTTMEELAGDREKNPYADYFEVTVEDYLSDDADVVLIVADVGGQIAPALTLADLLKSSSRAKVVLATGLSNRDALNAARARLPFDCVLLNDFENLAVEVLNLISGGTELEFVYSSDLNAKASVGMNNFEAPSFSDLPLHLYFMPETSLRYRTSRGCYWNKCIFCSFAHAERLDLKPMSLVMDELRVLTAEHRIEYLRFEDELISPSRLRLLTDGLIKNDLSFTWSCRARFDQALDRALLSRMREAGCEEIWFGLETASPRLWDVMNKGLNRATVDKIIHDCAETGIGVRLLLIAGFPSETELDIEATKTFLNEHAGRITSFSSRPFMLLEGSAMHSFPEKYGISANKPSNTAFQISYEYDTAYRSTKPLESRRALIDTLADQPHIRDQAEFMFPSHMLFYRSRNSRLPSHPPEVRLGGNPVVSELAALGNPKLSAGLWADTHRRLENGGEGGVYAAFFNLRDRQLVAFDLTPELEYLLTLCDGTRSIEEICQSLSRTSNQASNLINVFERLFEMRLLVAKEQEEGLGC